MPNLNSKTRKQLVYDYLRARANEWVSGLDLMNARVGGLRAGARIYELRQEGVRIDRRSSKTSDVDEYMLVLEQLEFPWQTAPSSASQSSSPSPPTVSSISSSTSHS